MNVYQFQEGRAYIFMQSSGQQGSGPEGADVSDSGSPAPPPFEKVRDFDLWPGKGEVRGKVWSNGESPQRARWNEN